LPQADAQLALNVVEVEVEVTFEPSHAASATPSRDGDRRRQRGMKFCSLIETVFEYVTILRAAFRKTGCDDDCLL
jgi:hypothetical protein